MLDGLPIVGFAVTDGPEVFRCCDVGRSGGDEQESRRGGEHNREQESRRGGEQTGRRKVGIRRVADLK